jgi:hypothetical protein
MADTTRKRDRRARRLEWQRRQIMARPIGPRTIGPRFDGPGWPTDPPREWPDDLDGGAGVREPRRPYPGMPAGALSLPEPDPLETLELAAHSSVP